MSSSDTKYMEINSAYRDRNQYPSPADFVLEISQSGQASRENAKDPISYAAPLILWNNSFTQNSNSNQITTISVDITFSPSSPNMYKITTVAPNSFRQVKNFYTGAVFNITVGGIANVRSRIAYYEPLSLNAALITLDDPLPVGVIGADGVIQNPTPLPTNSASPIVIKFFIPTGSGYDNAYVGYNVQCMGNAQTAEFRRITAYDGTYKLATLSSATTSDWSAVPAGDSGENFAVRDEQPANTGLFLGVSSDGRTFQLSSTANSQTNSYISSFLRITDPAPGESGLFVAHGGVGTKTFQLAATASAVNNYYKGATLIDATTGDFRTIATYVGGTQTGTVTENWSAGAAGDSYFITTNLDAYGQQKRIINYIAESGVFASFGGIGTSTFTFASNANNENNYYTGQFITTSGGDTFQITSYNGNTKQGSIAPAIWTAGAGTWFIRSATIQSSYTTPPLVGFSYEIEMFTRDNWNPFDYTGSLVSSQQAVCYQVELINLILPNTLLQSGSRAIYYPYMYVQFENISASSGGTRGVIYSNNPNSNKMLFRAVVDDSVQPAASPFVKIDSDGMVQTVKFLPNDSFKFSVTLPNGDIFTTTSTDNIGPLKPNPLVQISALFSIKRLD